ncbi:MAG: YncE family protein, partial [Maribacter sp.]|nr:YncE family protein [Maribacter sp.]
DEHPGYLGLDGSKLYYILNGELYSMATSAATLPLESEIQDLSFYTMVIKDGKMYGTDAKDFASNGSMAIYELSTKKELGVFEMGIIPGGVYFN